MEQLQLIIDKLDKIDARLADQQAMLAVQDRDIKQVFNEVSSQNKELDRLGRRVTELEATAHKWAGVSKAIAIIGILATIGAGLATMLKGV